LSRDEEHDQFGVIAREVIEFNIHRFSQGRLIGSCSPYLLDAFEFAVHRILIGKVCTKSEFTQEK